VKSLKITIYFPLILANTTYAISVDDVLNQLKPSIIDSVQKLLVVEHDVLFNCAPLTPQSAYDLEEAYREFVEDVGRMVVEQTMELSMAPHYPTVCSIYSNNIAKQYSDGSTSNWTVHSPDSMSDCTWHGHCDFTTVTAKALNPSYFWPKYFIETSEKGNDPYSAFSGSNPLYVADRKVAGQVANLVDNAGAVKLTAQVVGMSEVFDTALSAAGLPMKLDGADLTQVGQVAALTPLEAMRVRSNSDPHQAIFDSNIWPVGWSAAIGKLTVCSGYTDKASNQQIGYTWPAGEIGAPDTCPVAMSKDAFSYWDTGMLDYINPAAMSGMIAASNPATCAASTALTALASMDAVRASPLGDQGPIFKAAQTLGTSFSSVTGCSFPVIGSSAQIANQALLSIARFGGPWCSLWGSIAPRNSTLVQNTDYSFALMSQRFEMLSQELFGVPRPRHERWTLAYPWEGTLDLSGNPNPTGANPVDIVKTGIGKITQLIPGSSKLPEGTSTPASRSDTLLYPGDPRLMDTSLNSSYYAKRLAEFGKEAAYVTAGMAAGPIPWSAAEMARSKSDDLNGTNGFEGNKRVYTVWDNVTCKASFAKVTTSLGGVEINHQYYSMNPNGSLGVPSCKAWVHFELYKYFQMELLRQLCDLMAKVKILPGDQTLGAPFK